MKFLVMPKAGSKIQIFVSDEASAKSLQLQVAESRPECKLPPKQSSFRHRRVSDLGINKNERSHSLDPLQFLKDMEVRKRRASSISSLGNWTGAVIVSDATESVKNKNRKWFVGVI